MSFSTVFTFTSRFTLSTSSTTSSPWMSLIKNWYTNIFSLNKCGNYKFKRHTLSLELDLYVVWAQAQGQRRGQAIAIPGVHWMINYIIYHENDTQVKIVISFRIFSYLPLWASCPCNLSPPATHQQCIFLWNKLLRKDPQKRPFPGKWFQTKHIFFAPNR